MNRGCFYHDRNKKSRMILLQQSGAPPDSFLQITQSGVGQHCAPAHHSAN
jgi:hypothetical protein